MGDTSWAEERDFCIHCGEADFAEEFGPRTYVICSCCNGPGAHVECEEWAAGRIITEEQIISGSDWFCCEGCEKVSAGLSKVVGKRRPVVPRTEEYTLEIVKYSIDCKGSQQTVEAALKIFRGSFDPLEMSSGKELIHMVCTSYVTPDEDTESKEDGEAFDFGAFHVAVLRKGPVIVTAATLRLFGTRFAELPFVATRKGYRREGNCTRLMQGLECVLRDLAVQHLLIPSVLQVVDMWTHKFGLVALTKKEIGLLEDRIVTPDLDSAVLLKKRLSDQAAPAARAAKARTIKGCGKRKASPALPHHKQPAAKMLRASTNRPKADGQCQMPAVSAVAGQTTTPMSCDTGDKENCSSDRAMCTPLPSTSVDNGCRGADAHDVGGSKKGAAVRVPLAELVNASRDATKLAAKKVASKPKKDNPKKAPPPNKAAVAAPTPASTTVPSDAATPPLITTSSTTSTAPAQASAPHGCVTTTPPVPAATQPASAKATTAKPPRAAARKPRNRPPGKRQPAGAKPARRNVISQTAARALAGAVSKYSTATHLQVRQLAKTQQAYITRLQSRICVLQQCQHSSAAAKNPSPAALPTDATLSRKLKQLRQRLTATQASLRRANTRLCTLSQQSRTWHAQKQTLEDCAVAAALQLVRCRQELRSTKEQLRKLENPSRHHCGTHCGQELLPVQAELQEATEKLQVVSRSHGEAVGKLGVLQAMSNNLEEDNQQLTAPVDEIEGDVAGKLRSLAVAHDHLVRDNQRLVVQIALAEEEAAEKLRSLQATNHDLAEQNQLLMAQVAQLKAEGRPTDAKGCISATASKDETFAGLACVGVAPGGHTSSSLSCADDAPPVPIPTTTNNSAEPAVTPLLACPAPSEQHLSRQSDQKQNTCSSEDLHPRQATPDQPGGGPVGPEGTAGTVEPEADDHRLMAGHEASTVSSDGVEHSGGDAGRSASAAHAATMYACSDTPIASLEAVTPCHASTDAHVGDHVAAAQPAGRTLSNCGDGMDVKRAATTLPGVSPGQPHMSMETIDVSPERHALSLGDVSDGTQSAPSDDVHVDGMMDSGDGMFGMSAPNVHVDGMMDSGDGMIGVSAPDASVVVSPPSHQERCQGSQRAEGVRPHDPASGGRVSCWKEGETRKGHRSVASDLRLRSLQCEVYQYKAMVREILSSRREVEHELQVCRQQLLTLQAYISSMMGQEVEVEFEMSHTISHDMACYQEADLAGYRTGHEGMDHQQQVMAVEYDGSSGAGSVEQISAQRQGVHQVSATTMERVPGSFGFNVSHVHEGSHQDEMGQAEREQVGDDADQHNALFESATARLPVSHEVVYCALDDAQYVQHHITPAPRNLAAQLQRAQPDGLPLLPTTPWLTPHSPHSEPLPVDPVAQHVDDAIQHTISHLLFGDDDDVDPLCSPMAGHTQPDHSTALTGCGSPSSALVGAYGGTTDVSAGASPPASSMLGLFSPLGQVEAHGSPIWGLVDADTSSCGQSGGPSSGASSAAAASNAGAGSGSVASGSHGATCSYGSDPRSSGGTSHQGSPSGNGGCGGVAEEDVKAALDGIARISEWLPLMEE